jgi:hypothetical protein
MLYDYYYAQRNNYLQIKLVVVAENIIGVKPRSLAMDGFTPFMADFV